MAKKKKTGPEVVSLENARRKRELEGLENELEGLLGQQTDAVAQVLDLYHRWEAAHPGDAVSPMVRMDMVTFGFVGPAGYVKCHEGHRLPEAALFRPDDGFLGMPNDEELANDIMCPALANGTCRKVLAAMKSPPCILLGGEIQQAIAPKSMNSLVEALFDDRYADDPEDERFAAAEKLVRRYEEPEAAGKGPSKPRK